MQTTVNVWDYDEQRLLCKIPKEKTKETIKHYKQLYKSVTTDIDGDIVCSKRRKT